MTSVAARGDVQGGVVQPTGQKGAMVGQQRLALVPEQDGDVYVKLRTKGDGACGLHAMFGEPKTSQKSSWANKVSQLFQGSDLLETARPGTPQLASPGYFRNHQNQKGRRFSAS